jgi:signal transduction histidine kinase
VATAIAIAGWLVAGGSGVLLLRLLRRSELVAEAAHELRGPIAAFSYAVASLRREPGGVRRALRFEAELERMRAGLADLDAARAGERMPPRVQAIALEAVVHRSAAGWRAAASGADRGVTVRWEAGAARVIADRHRLSQAFGNLLANAAEHGSGPIEVHALRKGPHAVRVEVRDGGRAARPRRWRVATHSDRGRGLGIARRAIRTAGGSLELEAGPLATVAAVELPLAVDEAAR